MQVYLVIFCWVIMGMISANYAVKKGRDPIAWFVLGVFFGFIALIFLYYLPPLGDVKEVLSEESEPDNKMVEEEGRSEFLPPDYKFKQWFYIVSESEQLGPITFDALAEKCVEKSVTPKTLVWCEEMTDWKTIKDLKLFP